MARILNIEVVKNNFGEQYDIYFITFEDKNSPIGEDSIGVGSKTLAKTIAEILKK